MNENRIAREIVYAAFKVHKKLGPGLLESVYEAVLALELEKKGLPVKRQVPIGIAYEGLTFDEGFRADLVVGDDVIVELKSIEENIDRSQKAAANVFEAVRQTAWIADQLWV
jgi:GxxExxY protein